MSRARDLADGKFANDLTVDTNTLHVDAANNRVGVGTAAPSELLHLNANNPEFAMQAASDGGECAIYFKDDDGNKDGRITYRTDYAGNTDNFMQFFTNGSERLRVLGGGGLTFNGDTAAANALDDYEQGTWTPSVGGSATYTTQAGHYIKIGDMVFITGSLIINNISGAAHTNYLDGLPYGSVTGNGREGHISVQYFANLASTGTYFALRTNGDRLYGSAQRENDNTMVVNVDIFQNSTEVTFGGSYFVA